MNTKLYEIVDGVIGNADVSVTFASLFLTKKNFLCYCTSCRKWHFQTKTIHDTY
jgi:hypothetical protein